MQRGNRRETRSQEIYIKDLDLKIRGEKREKNNMKKKEGENDGLNSVECI